METLIDSMMEEVDQIIQSLEKPSIDIASSEFGGVLGIPELALGANPMVSRASIPLTQDVAKFGRDGPDSDSLQRKASMNSPIFRQVPSRGLNGFVFASPEPRLSRSNSQVMNMSSLFPELDLSPDPTGPTDGQQRTVGLVNFSQDYFSTRQNSRAFQVDETPNQDFHPGMLLETIPTPDYLAGSAKRIEALVQKRYLKSIQNVNRDHFAYLSMLGKSIDKATGVVKQADVDISNTALSKRDLEEFLQQVEVQSQEKRGGRWNSQSLPSTVVCGLDGQPNHLGGLPPIVFDENLQAVDLKLRLESSLTQINRLIDANAPLQALNLLSRSRNVNFSPEIKHQVEELAYRLAVWIVEEQSSPEGISNALSSISWLFSDPERRLSDCYLTQLGRLLRTALSSDSASPRSAADTHRPLCRSLSARVAAALSPDSLSAHFRSLLSAALCVGRQSHRTRSQSDGSAADRLSRHSAVCCPVTRDVCDGDNAALLQDCGHVVGRHSVLKTLEANRHPRETGAHRRVYRCPTCPNEQTIDTMRQITY